RVGPFSNLPPRPVPPFSRAAKPPHAGPNRPHARNLVEVPRRAGGVGHWPLAAQLVQAVSLAVSLIAERRREPSGVEVGASRAVLVDHTLIRESRTAILIELWQAPHGYVFQN